MEQFSLEKWLQNKSRKVVTRDGKSVRIVCWDLKCNTPIIAAIQWNQEREDCYCYNTKGRCANDIGELDLFFANDKLTEFEKTMIQFSHERNSLIQFEHTTEEINAHLYLYSEKLLDLARKEIREEQQEKLGTIEMPIDVTEPYYIKGKQDALKNLPKWKKATEHLRGEGFIHYSNHSRMTAEYAYTNVEGGEYYLNIDDLKTLPKEE